MKIDISVKQGILIARTLTVISVFALIAYSQHNKKPVENSEAPKDLIISSVPQNPEGESVEEKSEESIATDEFTGTEIPVEKKEEPLATEAPAPPRAELVVGIIADAHSGQAYGFSRLSSNLWSVQKNAAPDVLVNLGDLIESRLKYKNIKKSAAQADYRKAISFFRSPTLHTIGNHEVLSMSKKDWKSLTGRNNYYFFKIKGYNLIILDTNFTEDGKNIDASGDDTLIYKGMLPENQLDWLEKELKNNGRNLIFSHHPLNNLSNNGSVEKIIRKNKDRIVAIANGHKHPQILETESIGGEKLYKIPSAYFQRSYAVIKINGSSASVYSRKGS